MLGRPPLYKPEYCNALVDHMRSGMSFKSFGAIVGTGERVLLNWVHDYPEFKAAKELGDSCCAQWWENMGKQYAGVSSKEWSPVVYIFNMKLRHGLMFPPPGKGAASAGNDDKPPEKDTYEVNWA